MLNYAKGPSKLRNVTGPYDLNSTVKFTGILHVINDHKNPPLYAL